MLARNWRGVAVQLVKWYQYMAVCWQLNDRHHIQIFRGVHLDSYIICDLWSAVLQPWVISCSGLNYFSTLSLNQHNFLKKHFLSQNVCFDFLYNIFIIRKVDRELIKNIHKSSCQTAVFLVRFKRNLNFLHRFSEERKKNYWAWNVYSDFLNDFCLISLQKKNWTRYAQKCILAFMQSTRYSCQI